MKSWDALRSLDLSRWSRNIGIGMPLGAVLLLSVAIPFSATAAHAEDEEVQAAGASNSVSFNSEIQEVAAGPVDFTLPLGFSFTVVAGSTHTVSFHVPRGTVPAVFRATIAGTRTSDLRVSTGMRVAESISPGASEVEIPLDAGDVNENGQVVLSFAFGDQAGMWCSFERPGATIGGDSALLSGSVLGLTGAAAPPTTVSDFLGEGVREATVEVPSGSEGELGEAALNLVSSASAALGSSSDVRLVVDGAPVAASAEESGAELPVFAKRRILLAPGQGQVDTEIGEDADGIAMLTLTGGTEELLAASKAFSREGIALASAERTEGLAVTPGGDPTSTQSVLTLAELGTDRISLEGYGRQDAYLTVAQGAFGRTLGGLSIELRGAVSATSATVATIQFLWNDTLVDSFAVDPEQSSFERRIEIPGPSLRSGNLLTIRMQAVTADQSCVDERLLPQVRFDVDGQASTVTATSGVPVSAGFRDFPQTFGGKAVFAFGDEVSAAGLASAARLVAALQRATPHPLVLEQVTADELVGGVEPGILFGATPEQADALRTPLRFAPTRIISDTVGDLTVAVEQPFAALQAVRHNARSLLVLGAYLAGDDTDPAGVLDAAVAGLDGTAWWGLGGSVRLATPNHEPRLLDVGSIVPQEQTKADYAWLAWWFLAGGILLVAVGLIAASVRTRRKRAARRTVEAELAMLAAQDGDPASGARAAEAGEPQDM